MSLKEIYDLGEEIPLGQVPKKMHAFARFSMRRSHIGYFIDL